jgi:hypothetical protein
MESLAAEMTCVMRLVPVAKFVRNDTHYGIPSSVLVSVQGFVILNLWVDLYSKLTYIWLIIDPNNS